jgi:hypothetical protein
MVHPQRGAPNIDCHECVLSWERHHVALVGVLVEFHALSDGSRGHELFHHVAVPEFVLDGVGMVWASLLKRLLKVVCGLSCLVFAAACDSHGVHHARAACLLAVATVIVGRGYSLLKALLARLPAALAPSPMS